MFEARIDFGSGEKRAHEEALRKLVTAAVEILPFIDHFGVGGIGKEKLSRAIEEVRTALTGNPFTFGTIVRHKRDEGVRHKEGVGVVIEVKGIHVKTAWEDGTQETFAACTLERIESSHVPSRDERSDEWSIAMTRAKKVIEELNAWGDHGFSEARCDQEYDHDVSVIAFALRDARREVLR